MILVLLFFNILLLKLGSETGNDEKCLNMRFDQWLTMFEWSNNSNASLYFFFKKRKLVKHNWISVNVFCFSIENLPRNSRRTSFEVHISDIWKPMLEFSMECIYKRASNRRELPGKSPVKEATRQKWDAIKECRLQQIWLTKIRGSKCLVIVSGMID